MEKRDDKTRQVTVIMPEWMAEGFERWAKEDHRSLSGQVVHMVWPMVMGRLKQEQRKQEETTDAES